MFAVILAVVGTLGYWRWGYTWMHSEPITMTHRVLSHGRPGEVAQIEFSWQVHQECPRTVELFLINGHSFLLKPPHHGTSSVHLEPRRSVAKVTIPADWPDDYAIVRSTSEWRCTPLSRWRHTHDVRLEW